MAESSGMSSSLANAGRDILSRGVSNITDESSLSSNKAGDSTNGTINRLQTMLDIKDGEIQSLRRKFDQVSSMMGATHFVQANPAKMMKEMSTRSSLKEQSITTSKESSMDSQSDSIREEYSTREKAFQAERDRLAVKLHNLERPSHENLLRAQADGEELRHQAQQHLQDMLNAKKECASKDIHVHKLEKQTKDLVQKVADLKVEAAQLKNVSETAEKRRVLAEEVKASLEKESSEATKKASNLQAEKEQLLENVEKYKNEITMLKGLLEESDNAQLGLETALKGARALSDGLHEDFQREKRNTIEANEELRKTKAQLQENEELLRIASDSVSELSSRLDEMETRGRLEDKALRAILESKYAQERLKKEEVQRELKELKAKKFELENDLCKKNKQLDDIKQGNLSEVEDGCRLKQDLETVKLQCKVYEADIEKFQRETARSLDRISKLENTITANTEAAAERETDLEAKLVHAEGQLRHHAEMAKLDSILPEESAKTIRSLELQLESLQSDLDVSRAKEDELQKCCDRLLASKTANADGSVPVEIVEGTRARLSMAEEAQVKLSEEKLELESTVAKLREEILEFDSRVAKRDEMWDSRVKALQHTVEQSISFH